MVAEMKVRVRPDLSLPGFTSVRNCLGTVFGGRSSTCLSTSRFDNVSCFFIVPNAKSSGLVVVVVVVVFLSESRLTVI